MIHSEDIRRLAELARLQPSDDELETFSIEAGRILEYAEKLRELDISAIEPMTHAEPIENVFREDAAVESDPETIIRLTHSFPESEKGYLKVRSVFQHD